MHCVVALAVVAVLTGCGGSSEPEVFSLDDVRRAAAVRPITPDWNWPHKPISSGSYSDDGGTTTPDPLLAELNRQLVDLDFVGGAGSKWRDDSKLGNVAVEVWGTASDAQEAMPALRAFARGWGEKSGEVIKDEEATASATRRGDSGSEATEYR